MNKYLNKEELLNLLKNNALNLIPRIPHGIYYDKNVILKRFLIKNNLMECVKINLNKKNFTCEDLYFYLTNKNNICEKCGEELVFNSFKIGYKFCLKCIDKLKTKKEIYLYLINNIRKYSRKLVGKFDLEHPIHKKINYNYKDLEDLYLYLNDMKKPKCRLNRCKNNAKFNHFTKGYRDFCSLECNNKWLSESRMGENNPFHNITEENKKIMGEKISKKIKERIKNGLWTPPSTNSWCRSKYVIYMNKDNIIIDVKVRSSWEAFFQLMNPTFKYEKLRISYIYKNELHNYIVDFIDEKNKNVYELKPKSEKKKEKNIIKEKALLEWCKINNYTYNSINEDYFKNIKYDENLFKYFVKDYDKLKKFKKYFKDEN